MSMLAGPRRKQKVINLRAKNNAWSNDANKFGQKMLEKMGWSAGKGLGAKENGIVEHVVAKYKNDERGLGFEDKNDQWTKHEDDFNALLANLSNTESNAETLHSGISLEKKSKKSKARIHYHKFTRGKDLSRYSEKDLANIFGKKSFKETEVEEVLKDDVKTTEQVFTEKGTMDDYFKSKLANLQANSKLFNKKSITNDEQQISDYSFKGFSNGTEDENESNNNGLEIEKQPFSFYSFKKEDSSNEPDASINNSEIIKIKKKKKSKENNDAAGIKSNVIDTENHIETNGTENDLLKVKKSKKKKYQEEIEEIAECEQPKKKKKDKRKTEKIEQEETVICDDKLLKKKKKRKNHD